jgi:hypothetical protein
MRSPSVARQTTLSRCATGAPTNYRGNEVSRNLDQRPDCSGLETRNIRTRDRGTPAEASLRAGRRDDRKRQSSTAELYVARQRTRDCRVGATHRPHSIYGGLHPPYKWLTGARVRYSINDCGDHERQILQQPDTRLERGSGDGAPSTGSVAAGSVRRPLEPWLESLKKNPPRDRFKANLARGG